MSTSTAFFDWLVKQEERLDNIGCFARMAIDSDRAPKRAMRSGTWRKWVHSLPDGAHWESAFDEAFTEFARQR